MRPVIYEMEISVDSFLLPYPSRDTIERHKELRPFFDKIPEDAVGAEVGVLECNNAYFVCKYNKPKLLYLVDEYKKYNDVIGDLGIFTQELWEDVYKTTQERMQGFPVKFIRANSVDGAKDIPDESLDFCYIDANHAKNYVTKDILAWYPKVKQGGVFGGHDWVEIEVRSAVNEWYQTLEEPNMLENAFNDWWIIK